jgi:hypothetical protein
MNMDTRIQYLGVALLHLRMTGKGRKVCIVCRSLNGLNTAILFMQGIRVIDADQNADEHPEFRLLIPTFYHIVIQSPLNFPSNIEPFKVYGERFDNEYLVYMNLPNVNESNLISIKSYRTTLWKGYKSSRSQCLSSTKPRYNSLIWTGTGFGDFSPPVSGHRPFFRREHQRI